MNLLQKLFIVLTGVGAALAVTPGVADAHHNRYQNIYHSQNSVVPVLTMYTDTGAAYGLGRGASRCCFVNPSVYLGPDHDVIVTSRERPGYVVRLGNTGRNWIPRPNDPGHLTLRVVPNGGN